MSIALNVITGFLGSGKTTLLKRLLQDEAMGDSALLINGVKVLVARMPGAPRPRTVRKP